MISLQEYIKPEAYQDEREIDVKSGRNKQNGWTNKLSIASAKENSQKNTR